MQEKMQMREEWEIGLIWNDLPAKRAPCRQRSSGRGDRRASMRRDSRASANVTSSAVTADSNPRGADHSFVREAVACDPQTLALGGKSCRPLPRHRAEELAAKTGA